MIDLGGQTLLEIFAIYEKIAWRSFLLPKSAKKDLFCLKRVWNILNGSFEAGGLSL